MREHLVSIRQAAEKLGHDPRTIAKIAQLAEPRVVTRTGRLFDLAELRHLLLLHKPHLTARSHMARNFTDI